MNRKDAKDAKRMQDRQTGRQGDRETRQAVPITRFLDSPVRPDVCPTSASPLRPLRLCGSIRLSQRRARRGFTLVEMVVATMLLMIGVVAAMGAIHTAAQTALLADSVQTAALLAQQQITQLELQPDQLSGGDQQGEFGDEHPGYKWQQNIEATDYTNLFKVTMTITWGSNADQHKRDFVTYLSNGQTIQPANGTTTGTTPTTTSTQGSGNGQ